MQHRPEITREAVAEHLSSDHREASRRGAASLAASLLRIWLMITPAAALADAWLAPAWPVLLLVATGLGLSLLAMLRAQSRPRRRAPVANLSAASNCVWKMDVEG